MAYKVRRYNQIEEAEAGMNEMCQHGWQVVAISEINNDTSGEWITVVYSDLAVWVNEIGFGRPGNPST
ncbi:MAG: hypothetical protein HZC36_02400 [Armatimonadetes bacterium]|nr:hypothetical protein [Armatimonadota bacterium]